MRYLEREGAKEVVAFLLVFVFSVLWTAPAFTAEKLSNRMPAQEGETCLVCDKGVTENGVAYLANGQRVALHAGDMCEAQFLRRPTQYMAPLRPSSILFSNAANVGISDRWLWVGIFVLLGLAFGGLCAHMAVQKGRSPLGWFFVGLLFSIPAYVCLCLRTPTEQAAGHPSAERCTGCGAKLTPTAPSEVTSVRPA
jgi:hypothetical protein